MKRSPLFYVGDKYKLIEEIKQYFPSNINNFIEPFTGGGTVFLNVQANKYLLNDIDKNICDLHKFLIQSSRNPNKFFDDIKNLILQYNLSRSYLEDIVPTKFKQQWKKTYYAKFNKVAYNKLKEKYNSSKEKNMLELYLLLIYGFNRMLRFNAKGEFNIPVGDVDFNKNVFHSLQEYFGLVKTRIIVWNNLDFVDFMNSIEIDGGDFVYLDPPYLISFSEYNKLWNKDREAELLKLLDKISKNKAKFAISNIVRYKNRENKMFEKWMANYNVYKIRSNYISYYDNSIKKIEEVLVTNYDKA